MRTIKARKWECRFTGVALRRSGKSSRCTDLEKCDTRCTRNSSEAGPKSYNAPLDSSSVARLARLRLVRSSHTRSFAPSILAVPTIVSQLSYASYAPHGCKPPLPTEKTREKTREERNILRTSCHPLDERGKRLTSKGANKRGPRCLIGYSDNIQVCTYEMSSSYFILFYSQF